MESSPVSILRRAFLGGLTVAACSHNEIPPQITSGSVPKDVPKRALGRTGVTVSAVGLGGYHVGLLKDDDDAIKLVRNAIDRGVTFLDNCWDYHDGKSEIRIGKALQSGYRNRAFVMTKIDGRTKKAAAAQIAQSLERLQTNRIDLMQIHEVIRPGDPVRCFSSGGCIEALLDAKAEGKIRFIGFTGHKHPDIHLAMLRASDQYGFKFDAVQLPLNVMDAHFRSFEQKVLPQLVERGIAVLGMKPLGAGKILETKTVSAQECLRYALTLPTSVVITGCEKQRDLDQAIEVATQFKPYSKDEIVALLSRTRGMAMDGAYETFKTTGEHDGTEKHPEWLESA